MKIILFLLIVALSASGVFYIFQSTVSEKIINPLANDTKLFEKPFEKYSFARLRETTFPKGEITIGDAIEEEDEDFDSYKFYFSDDGKKVSGLLNIPSAEGTYPLIVMFRGFVEKEQFTPGEGTRRSAEEFARQGFITLAPDFLGYGESDNPSEKPIEERFQTYTTALSLLSSIQTLNNSLIESGIKARWREGENNIGIWGHSNGGHIALSVLEITGRSYPTVLWAPVSKPFPYSILYYTDEFDDHGKALRKVVSDFEKDYDVEKYSLTNFLSWINAPISLHQGIDDEEVPFRWSNQLEELLKKNEIDVEYFTYPGENHNFNAESWPLAMEKSITFYNNQFSN